MRREVFWAEAKWLRLEKTFSQYDQGGEEEWEPPFRPLWCKDQTLIQNRILRKRNEPCLYFPTLQAKLAARRARRQEEARRQAEESAAQRILEEQSQAIAANRPMDADHVIVPDVIIPRETSEEEVGTSTQFIWNIY